MGREKIDRKDKKCYRTFVWLALSEYAHLCELLGKEVTEKWIEELDLYIGSKGDKYKSHYYTIQVWAKRAKGSSSHRIDATHLTGHANMSSPMAAKSAADHVIEELKFPSNRTMPQMEEKIKEALFSVMRKRKMNWFDLRDKRHYGTFMEEIHADIVKEYK